MKLTREQLERANQAYYDVLKGVGRLVIDIGGLILIGNALKQLQEELNEKQT